MALQSGIDWASFLAGLLPAAAIVVVCVLAFRRRRRHGSPSIINPYTLALEPDADAHGRLPVTQPAPPTTTSQTS